MQKRLTLEKKFIALSFIVIVLISVAGNSWIISTYREQIYDEAERRAVMLTEATAISFTNTLLYQELGLVEEGGLLENIIQELISDSARKVTSVTVYNNDGVAIASSDFSRFYEHPSPELVSFWHELTQAHLARYENGKYIEILFPLKISTRQFGTLNMSFTLNNAQLQLAAFEDRILMLTVVLATLGILMAFLLARMLAKPIKRLVVEMREVRDPTHLVELDIKRRDEIGELERGFVDMLNRLKSTADEKERQQRALIQAEKLASVGTLVSGLAHEINNPLGGIRNCLRRIIEHPEDLKQTHKYAQLMDSALLRIEKVVKGLLDFSRKKEFVFQRADLNLIIRAACGLMEYKLREQKLQLNLQLAQNLPAIEGDSHHLEQVFVNLLLNAIDVTSEGGVVTVKTGQQNSKVIAEVADCGTEIPSEIKEKIFDPFFTTKVVGKGTGLGLSITKAIVEEHRGSIEVSSDSNGTTFRLHFSGCDNNKQSSDKNIVPHYENFNH